MCGCHIVSSRLQILSKCIRFVLLKPILYNTVPLTNVVGRSELAAAGAVDFALHVVLRGAECARCAARQR